MEKHILTINGGSSSIKFALYTHDAFSKVFSGKIDRIGLPGSVLAHSDSLGKEETQEIVVADYGAAIEKLDTFLGEHIDFSRVAAVGHRIVHGMERKDHTVVSRELIAELKGTSSIDPEHLPLEIAIIEMFTQKHTEIIQVACFDTVFHFDLPRVAQLLPLPRRFDTGGVRRYGFHGLSFASIMEELSKIDPENALGRVIIAHLGNGVSITAIKEGKSFDTSMGFTPTGGVPMSTRTGDIDPGALLYIMNKEKLSSDALSKLINHESGLLGISETSSNMYDLLEREGEDERAREAVDLFCYEVKKQIGAYAAALGGIDILIFTGGMGEHAPRIHRRVCEGLQFLGITIDAARDQGSEGIISNPSGSVCVRVMKTDEELMIAKIVSGLVNK